MNAGATNGSMKVVIVGGGISGLALAALLRKGGTPHVVAERAPEFGPVGAGIILQPNAAKALRAAGIADGILSRGEPMQRMEIRDSKGALLSSMDTGVFEHAFGAPVTAFHRATLHQALLDLVDPAALHANFDARSFDETPGGVVLRAASGEELTGTVLIGADGLHSVVRRQLLNDGPPEYSGYTSWRGVTARGSLWPAGHMCESWGRGARFGLVAIDGGRLYWFATANENAGGRDASKADLLRRFEGFHDPIRAVLESTPDHAILRTDVADRTRAPFWSQGRAALIGDAAHPMTPNLGQGGCQGIEDAVIMGRCLAGAADVGAAFRRYESLRLDRASRVVREARRFGAIGQLENGLIRKMRDLALRATPLSLTLRSVRWLYEFEA